MSNAQEHDSAETNALIEQAAPPSEVKAAGGVLAGIGLLVVAVGLQTVLLPSSYWLVVLSAWTMLIAGAGAIYVGLKLWRGRDWTLEPAFIGAGFMLVGSGLFCAWSFAHGLFSLLALLAVAGGAVALVFVALAVAPFKRMRKLRAQLRQRGIDMDFDF